MIVFYIDVRGANIYFTVNIFLYIIILPKRFYTSPAYLEGLYKRTNYKKSPAVIKIKIKYCLEAKNTTL